MLMALKILVGLYAVGVGWCFVAALRAYQRTGWDSWNSWVRGLSTLLMITVVVGISFIGDFSLSPMSMLGLVGCSGMPLLIVLVRILIGSQHLEGFARARDWLLLVPPDSRLMQPIPVPEQAGDTFQVWVPPAQPHVRFRIPLGIWLTLLLVYTTLALIMIIGV